MIVGMVATFVAWLISRGMRIDVAGMIVVIAFLWLFAR
jgi:Na+-transporting methylmalonyl-CoA/oxaloacetate decarboxylase gamma subunit